MNRRQISIDELLARLDQNYMPADNQIAPIEMADEYRVVDESSIRDDELSKYVGDTPEIDLNANRNAIKHHRFWC